MAAETEARTVPVTPPAPRELEADVARTARLAERQANAAAHAAALAALFDAPAPKDLAIRMWRTHYWIAGELHAVKIEQWFNPPRTVQNDAPPVIRVWLTTSHHGWPNNFKFYGMPKGYDTIEAVAFLGLDALPPDGLEWRDVTIYRTIITVPELVERSTTRPND